MSGRRRVKRKTAEVVGSPAAGFVEGEAELEAIGNPAEVDQLLPETDLVEQVNIQSHSVLLKFSVVLFILNIFKY
jgi:hypothetical protein